MLADKTIKRPGEERLNARTLQDELQQLADRAGQERSALILNFMAASRSQALAVRCVPAAQADSAVSYHGRLGGSPLLPQNFDWPKDRLGAPMIFIAQFDLGRLPVIDVNRPKQGLVSIFRSPQILTMPVKDRRSFHISYLPQFDYELLQAQRPPLPVSPDAGPGASQTAGQSPPVELTAWAVLAAPSWTVSEQLDDLAGQCNLSPTEIDELKAWAHKFNCFSCGNSLFFSANLAGLAEQKEVCAFAASGISHSPARARDRHFDYLLDDAPNWLLLAKFDEAGLFNDGTTITDRHVAETRFLIRREDLKLGLFDRGWIICLQARASGAA